MPPYRCDTLKGSRAGALAGCLTAPGASPLIDWPGIIPCAAEALACRAPRPPRSSASSTRWSTALPGSPADFGNLIADETEKWAKVIKFAGINPHDGPASAVGAAPVDGTYREPDPPLELKEKEPRRRPRALHRRSKELAT